MALLIAYQPSLDLSLQVHKVDGGEPSLAGPEVSILPGQRTTLPQTFPTSPCPDHCLPLAKTPGIVHEPLPDIALLPSPETEPPEHGGCLTYPCPPGLGLLPDTPEVLSVPLLCCQGIRTGSI